MRADLAWVPPDSEGEVANALATSRPWQPVDLSAVLSGDWSPPEPTVGRRSDGIGLLYLGKVHTAASESEAGKTWFAGSVAVDEMIAGHHVTFIDFEDDEGGVVGRLLSLQVSADTIAAQFHYVRPNEPLGAGIHRDDLTALVRDTASTLVVIDGVTEAMTLHTLDPLNNKDVATFGRILPRRVAELGPAVLCLDHVTKSSDNRGRYAVGAVHKLNAVDGAAFILESRTPFGIGLTGRSTVKIAKDRPGQLRRHGHPSAGGMFWIGDLVLISHDDTFVEVSVEAPERVTTETFRPTHVMAKISEVLAERGDLSGRQIQTAVGGKAATVRDAISWLQIDGHISNKSPHELLKPYTAEAS